LPLLSPSIQQGGETESLSPGTQADQTATPPKGQNDKSENQAPHEVANETKNPPAGEQHEEESEVYTAPDFTVQDADGNDVKLSDLRGKPVVLNFWASWCPPCKVEMPDFEKVFSELGGNVQFMMVCLVDGERETVKTGAAHITNSGYTFPVYYDITMEAAMTYSIRSIPTTYFIDAEGYLVTGAQGAINEETLRLGIEMVS